MKKAMIFLAEGFEEMEAVTPLDLLHRAGVDAKFVSLTGRKEVIGAHDAVYTADLLFDKAVMEKADMLILPGGMPGAKHLQEHEGLKELLLSFHKKEKFICAICAAPMVLGCHGILKGKKATIYPGMEELLLGAEAVTTPVCRDGHIITSRAPGTAIPFALELIEALCGKPMKEQITADIVYH